METYKNKVNTRFINTCSLLISRGVIKNKAELATVLGIKSNKLSEILSNRMRAGMSEVHKLCSKYAVSYEYILGGEGEILKKSECNTDKENNVVLHEKDSNLTKKYEELKVMYNEERKRVNKLLDVVEKQQGTIDTLSKDEGAQGGVICVDVG